MTIAFVYIGILKNSSRILKQIHFLRSQGFDVKVFVGNENDVPQDYSDLNFEVHEFTIWHGGFLKIKSLINPLLFNFQVAQSLAKEQFEFVVCQELTTFLSGFLAKTRGGSSQIVFDNNELSVERYHGLKKFIWSFIQRKIIRIADVIIHAEQHRMDYFITKHKLTDKRNVLVCNYPKILDAHYTGTREARMIYLGVIHPNRMLEEIIQATARGKINLDVIGPGQSEYIAKIESIIAEYDHINLLPPISQVDIQQTLSRYTVGVAFYSNNNLNNFLCAPNKVFQYIMSGLNIVTNDYPGLISIVRENKIGVCLSEITPGSIEAALVRIERENMSSNISSELRSRYSWESQTPALKTIFCYD